MTKAQNVDPSEIKKFEDMASRWWDLEGEFKPLHQINPLRLNYVLDNAGGLFGVYAEENSRDSIFDSLRRRETFGTSGPRIEPRFFAGWNFDPNPCEKSDAVREAYDSGIALGGVLPANASAPKAGPRFLASATRDPASLD